MPKIEHHSGLRTIWRKALIGALGVGLGLGGGCASPDPTVDVTYIEGEDRYTVEYTFELRVVGDFSDDVRTYSYAVEIDGEPSQSGNVTVFQGTEPLVQIVVDTSAMEIGEHTVSIDVSGPDGETAHTDGTFSLAEALVVSPMVPVDTDDGVFGGELEPELHLYDASTNAWMGCIFDYGARPLLILDPGGAPFSRADLEGGSYYILYTEDDDGQGCPSPPSVGDPAPLENDDDLGVQTSVFGDAELSGGTDVGGITVAWGRGHL